jgi:hypothetical protein
MSALSATYVLPLRWDDDRCLTELTSYLRWLRKRIDIIVIDGSPDHVFEAHARAWSGLVRHLRPQGRRFLNGKVTGLTTGVLAARTERVIVADDDVRYDHHALRSVVSLLDRADLVGPQNVFEPMPWHAVWDSSRSLLNRALAADYPGTFGLRRSTFLAMDGYDGDVLFENLELMRTVRAWGGVVIRPRDVYVKRRPPTVRHFAGQRVRQAYDDTAQPWRLALFLPLLPTALSGELGRRIVAGTLLGSAGLAEMGRRRARGRRIFPARASLAAPLWVAERAVCSWLAIWRLVVLGGVRYADQRLATAAHSGRTLRQRATARRSLITSRGAESAPVGSVAERLESGAATATQRDGASAGLDHLSVRPEDAEVATHQERPVRIRRDDRRSPTSFSPAGHATRVP